MMHLSYTNPSLQTRRKAFTLVELLIVITILALLAAILFPVFARVRENARRTACLSNMKQIGLGFLQYSQDYDERAVPWATSMATDTNGLYLGLAFRWDELVAPYVKSIQVFTCPSFVRVPSGGTKFGYTYNRDVGRDGRNLNTVILPAQSPMFVEAEGESKTPSFVIRSNTETGDGIRLKNYSFGEGWEASNPYARPSVRRHFNGGSYLFVDGHVKWFLAPNPASGSVLARIGLDYDIDGVVGNGGGPSNTAGVGID